MVLVDEIEEKTLVLERLRCLLIESVKVQVRSMSWWREDLTALRISVARVEGELEAALSRLERESGVNLVEDEVRCRICDEVEEKTFVLERLRSLLSDSLKVQARSRSWWREDLSVLRIEVVRVEGELEAALSRLKRVMDTDIENVCVGWRRC